MASRASIYGNTLERRSSLSSRRSFRSRRDTQSSTRSSITGTTEPDPDDNTVPNDNLDKVILALRFSVRTMKMLGQPSHKVKKVLTHGYAGRFCMVFDIAHCSQTNRLFVADVKYIHIFDPERECALGGFKTKAKTVLGLTVISQDKIALTDLLRQCVLIYNTKGKLIRQIGSENALQSTRLEQRFSFPSGIAHYGGRLYIADTNKHRISVWSKKGKFEHHLTNECMKYPDRVVVNINGDLLVRCSNQNEILVLDPDGVVKTSLGRAGREALDTPTSLSVVDGQYLHVTSRSGDDLCIDTFNNDWGHVIRFITNIGPDNVSAIVAANGKIFIGKRSEIYIF